MPERNYTRKKNKENKSKYYKINFIKNKKKKNFRNISNNNKKKTKIPKEKTHKDMIDYKIKREQKNNE